MKHLIKFAFLAAVVATLHAGAGWLTDPVEASKKARAENKFVFVEFTGSDWCPPCKKLKANVLDTPTFDEFAKKKLVLLEVDFPKRKELSAEQKAENAKLKARFRVTGYPTVILLDKNSRELGRMVGFSGDSAEAYVQKLEGWMTQAGPVASAAPAPSAK